MAARIEDDALRAAGTEQARAIVAATASDSDNVFITLSAIELNPKIFVHARGETPEGARRLHLAGAHQVISPHQLGGKRIANAIVRPAEPTRMKPGPDDVLEVGDHVVVIGDRDDLGRFEALAEPG